MQLSQLKETYYGKSTFVRLVRNHGPPFMFGGRHRPRTATVRKPLSVLDVRDPGRAAKNRNVSSVAFDVSSLAEALVVYLSYGPQPPRRFGSQAKKKAISYSSCNQIASRWAKPVRRH